MIRRSLLQVALLASSALAGPPLTTIQDVLYKADGTRFNGTLTISWSSFEAIDTSDIATQSTTVQVVDGNLRVQLVPTTSATPAVYYTVTYNSEGRIQFQETWAVPSSAQTLRVRDVRIAMPGAASGAASADTGGTGGTVQESDVVGLVADLAARPLKGPGYAAGRVALVNSLGALESVIGASGDCVRVDGSSGACGAAPPGFVDAEALSGIVDGANTAFSLSATPNPSTSLAVYRNGMLQQVGVDYTVAARSIQFAAGAVPQPGDTLLASYRVSGGAGGSGQLFPSPQVLCSGLGATTNGTALVSIGSCGIPAGLLAAGDRVEIRLDLAHQGATSGFTFDVHWGDQHCEPERLACGHAGGGAGGRGHPGRGGPDELPVLGDLARLRGRRGGRGGCLCRRNHYRFPRQRGAGGRNAHAAWVYGSKAAVKRRLFGIVGQTPSSAKRDQARASLGLTGESACPTWWGRRFRLPLQPNKTVGATGGTGRRAANRAASPGWRCPCPAESRIRAACASGGEIPIALKLVGGLVVVLGVVLLVGLFAATGGLAGELGGVRRWKTPECRRARTRNGPSGSSGPARAGRPARWPG